MLRHWMVGIAVLATALISANAEAVSLADIDEASKTDFADQTANLDDTIFNAPGDVFFVGIPGWYVTGSTRSWGFLGGPGVALIEFTVPMQSVTLAARGSADGEFSSVASQLYGAANGSIEILGPGDSSLGFESITNDSLRAPGFQLITLDATELGAPISGIKLINDAEDPVYPSYVMIGAIGVTPADAPEPMAALLLGLAVALLAARRRSSAPPELP